jgi:acyl-CoA thioesterase-2
MGSSDELLGMTEVAHDVWSGDSPAYPWGWVYGGRVAAQALRAAALSSDPAFAPSTLHCTFLRPGRLDLPREHHVERLADTRRRAARSVVVKQGEDTLAHATATLDAMPGGTDDGVGDLECAPQDALEAARAGRFRGDAFEVGWFKRRLLDLGPGRTAALLTLDQTPASIADAACAIAYAADDLPTDAARAVRADESYLDGPRTSLWSLTATYAMHFGVQPSGPELVFDTRTVGILGSRATIEGTVVDLASGRVVALCLQQVMMRKRKVA